MPQCRYGQKHMKLVKPFTPHVIHRRSQGGAKGDMASPKFLKLKSFCNLSVVFPNKMVLFA